MVPRRMGARRTDMNFVRAELADLDLGKISDQVGEDICLRIADFIEQRWPGAVPTVTQPPVSSSLMIVNEASDETLPIG